MPPTDLPDQNWTVPAFPDDADAPFGFTDFAADQLKNVILRYANTATRDSFNGSRTAGDISFVTGNTWYDRWTGSKWLPVTPIRATKGASQSVNNSTALVNVTDLVVPLPVANTRYLIDAWIYYSSGTTADIKFTFTGPAGMNCWFSGPGLATSAAASSGDVEMGIVFAPATIAFGGTGADVSCRITGTVETLAATGNLQLQFAQNALQVVNTTVAFPSWLTVQAIQ